MLGRKNQWHWCNYFVPNKLCPYGSESVLFDAVFHLIHDIQLRLVEKTLTPQDNVLALVGPFPNDATLRLIHRCLRHQRQIQLTQLADSVLQAHVDFELNRQVPNDSACERHIQGYSGFGI